ncbi:hypothetical protein SAY86_015938 [Trapa natans]|uniref:Uncharacterized protein n=1 Tax=Trapa natans TaxID=22666 RepID=A0AAN7LJE8_TRANT|nr:hypothetical protein SAY86_015938 [Trapa natans]
MASSRRDLFSGPLAAHHPSDADHVSLNHSPAPAAASLEDLEWPFGFIDGLDRDSIRETAYEIFFTSCRSSPGFSTRSVPGLHLLSHQEAGGNGGGDGGMGSSGTSRASGVGMAPTSRVKKALGLKMLRRSPSKRMTSGRTGAGATNNPTSPSWHSAGGGGGGSGPLSSVGLVQTVPLTRTRRPLTSAEIMRQQMRVTEQSDNRLRKTLTRTLVGQRFTGVPRLAATPVEGARARPSPLPFHPHREVQRRRCPPPRSHQGWRITAPRHQQVLRLDADSLQLRRLAGMEVHQRGGGDGGTRLLPLGGRIPPEHPHLHGTPAVGLRREGRDGGAGRGGRALRAHEEDVVDPWDNQANPQRVLRMGAVPPVRCHVGVGAGPPPRVPRDAIGGVQGRPEAGRAGGHIHEDTVVGAVVDEGLRGTIGLIENILPLAITVSKIMGEDVPLSGLEGGNDPKGDSEEGSSMDRVAYCIRSSLDNAFTKILEMMNYRHTVESRHEASEALLQLAKETEDLALREREYFSPILKKWHPSAVGIAAVVLHNCYEKLLKQFLCGPVKLTRDCVDVLQRAGKLENFLVQMVVEDVSPDSDEGASGKAIVREMVPYDVDSVILKLLKQWIDDKMKKGKDCLRRAREVETWNPKSKTEPYAQSAVQLMKTVKETVEEFFELPIGITEDLIQDLADDLGHLFQDYISFAASCGSKQSYLPSLPPLTRCHRNSRFMKLFKRAAPCSILPVDDRPLNGGSVCGASNDGHSPRPSTSRGTQRIYIRLNSLHYLLTYIHSLNKTLTLSPRVSPARSRFINRRRRQQGGNSSYYFDVAKSSIQSACQHVCEVAAYRLIFLDSSSAFYESLYTGGVTTARIQPILRILKQNLALMCVTLTDRAQPQAMREVMKVSFEAFLMVLLAGGNDRVFYQSDYKMIKEDFAGLKRVISTCSEGLVPDETVERDAESVEGVIALMGQPTEQLIEDFTIVTCEAGGIGMLGQKLPMPPTTRRWQRSDPNTILRVLCHRNDHLSKQFLKKSFQLAKRK